MFGIALFRRIKEAISTNSLSAVGPRHSDWGTIGESFAGAWQRNIEVDSSAQILAFGAVFSAVSLIARDVAKLRIKLTQQTESGVWEEVTTASPFLPVLRKPNRYQTRIQFLSQWITSKLLHGNAYILKERDQRGIVVALYVLDPQRVTPLVATDGGVYYQLNDNHLSGLSDQVTVPASEIIHDRAITLWHPLIGVSPIYACGASATQGMRIQANSARFFENMSRPSGHLTAPGQISDDNARRLKGEFETNFGGSRIGRLLVTGDGVKYEAMTIPAVDAQLIEQLRWTVDDVCRCFQVPLHMLASGPPPTFNNIGALNQGYYTQTLQEHIESVELLLDEGLSLPAHYGTELDVDALLRMDAGGRYDSYSKAVGAGWMAPNEARARESLPPVPGGATPYMQQQNWSLAQLDRRDTPPGLDGGTTPSGKMMFKDLREDELAARGRLNGHDFRLQTIENRLKQIEYAQKD